MSGITVRHGCALLTAACAMWAAPSRAQLLDRFLPATIAGRGIDPGVTVTSRERPDFEAGGIRAGAFIIRPELTESVGYETNVLGTKSARGSALVQTSASVDAASDMSRGNVRAALRVDDYRYLDLPRQSFTNWSASLSGSYEIGRDTLTASYSHLNFTQTVRDLDVPRLDQALSVQVDAGRLEYRVPINRVSLTPAIEVSTYDYGSGSVLGTNYQQNYRNRVVVSPSVLAGYEFSPRRNALLVVRDSIASYSNRTAGQPQRDYNDVAVLGGLDYDVNGIIRFRLLGGYQVRTFSSAFYKTIAAPVVEGSVIWVPTGLTTVTGTVARRIQDSADESTASFTETSIQLRVDHEFLRNVLLQATAAVFQGEYRGGGNQTLYTAGAGAGYQLNRNVRVGATYDFFSRQSDDNSTLRTLGTTNQQLGSSFSDHRILLQARFRL